MSITSGQTSVTTARVHIDGSDRNPMRLTIQNNDNTKTLYLGGSTVTTSNGLALLKQELLQLTLNPGEALYAVSSDDSGHVVSWLRQVY